MPLTPSLLLATVLLLANIASHATQFHSLTVRPSLSTATIELPDSGLRYSAGVLLPTGRHRVRLTVPGKAAVERYISLESDRKVHIDLAGAPVSAPANRSDVEASLGEAPFLSNDATRSRYSITRVGPSSVQRIPLGAPLPLAAFPSEVRSVGDAVVHALHGSGYVLADSEAASPRQAILLGLPLPVVHRRLGGLPLHEALGVLAGPGWRLVVDPVHRRVAFEVATEFSVPAPTAATWKPL